MRSQVVVETVVLSVCCDLECVQNALCVVKAAAAKTDMIQCCSVRTVVVVIWLSVGIA